MPHFEAAEGLSGQRRAFLIYNGARGHQRCPIRTDPRIPEWIEAVFGVEPDRGSGALEWAIAIGFLTAAATLFALGRRDRQRVLVAES